jgi:hypothetical protein
VAITRIGPPQLIFDRQDCHHVRLVPASWFMPTVPRDQPCPLQAARLSSIVRSQLGG